MCQYRGCLYSCLVMFSEDIQSPAQNHHQYSTRCYCYEVNSFRLDTVSPLKWKQGGCMCWSHYHTSYGLLSIHVNKVNEYAHFVSLWIPRDCLCWHVILAWPLVDFVLIIMWFPHGHSVTGTWFSSEFHVIYEWFSCDCHIIPMWPSFVSHVNPTCPLCDFSIAIWSLHDCHRIFTWYWHDIRCFHMIPKQSICHFQETFTWVCCPFHKVSSLRRDAAYTL